MTESSAAKSSSRSARSGAAGSRPRRSDGAVDLGGLGDADLAAAVVAAGHDLQAQRQAEGVGPGGGLELGDRPDLAPRRDGDAGGLDEAPLGEPVLGDHQRTTAGPDRHARVERVDHLRRDVLELVGDDVAHARPSRSAASTSSYVPRMSESATDGRRAVRVRVEDRDPVAHRPRREAEHATELTATEDADRRRRQDGARGRRGNGQWRVDGLHATECRLAAMRLVVGRRTTDVDVG